MISIMIWSLFWSVPKLESVSFSLAYPGRAPDMPPHGPVWFGGLIVLGFLWVIVDAASLGTEILVAEVLGTVLEDPKPINWALFAVSVLCILWGACWFSATAVLAWDRISQKQASRRIEPVVVAKVSPDDLRALRE